MFRQTAITLLIVCAVPFLSIAQDNNLLAKVAYENAETALSEKKYTEGINELKKVDDLLGKLTPKSQFLRVQLWIGAAEANAGYLDSAIQHSKKYLALSKSFDIAEEKQLEVLRQMQKLEKDKLVYESKVKEDLAAKAILQNVDAIAAAHDPANLASLTGIDIGQDMIEELIKAGRATRKDINSQKKHKTLSNNTYVHKGHWYTTPSYSFINFPVGKRYRIKGLDTDVRDAIYYVTKEGFFQELRLELLNPSPTLITYSAQLSDILGFQPDAYVMADAQVAEEGRLPVWFFKDYTVCLQKNTNDFAKIYGVPFLLRIVRHYPIGATPISDAQLAIWK